MNWPGLIVSAGLVFLALTTLPYGLLLLAGLYWIWRRS